MSYKEEAADQPYFNFSVSTNTNTFNGTYDLSVWNSTGTTYDSLIVSMNLTGTNGVLGGTGSINYGKHDTGGDTKIIINGAATGAYSDSNLGVVITDKVTSNKFIYNGTKSSSSSGYQGDALIITSTDTLTFGNTSVYKSN